jgi:Tfp pilus assembly protein PilX
MAYTSTSKKSRSSGIALVTVLVITVVVLALITVLSGLAVRSSRVTSSDITATSLAQMADGWSDVGRIAIAENFSASKLQAAAWLNMIASNRATTPLINPTNAKVSALAGVKSATIDGVTLRWKIVGISKSTDSKAWLLLASTAVDAQGRSQTVTRKVEFASNSIFDLAILTKKTDCMFCHLRVDGDVGSIGFFRPGWGIDAQDNSDGKNRNGQNSGGPSSITGNVYVSTTISADGAAGTANGTTIGGTKNVNYNGDKLPKNSSGQAEFPGLDRALAESSATGSISGGEIKGVPIGGSFASATPVTSVGGVYDGNLVLIGTDANPIVLDSDIYVKGDVVIKGVVKGRGAIYSSRNMYVAGNLTNKNKADKPGAVGGVCATIPDKDACARANITAGKDEVRLSAGNNIVLGDYTDSKDGVVSRQNKQANDYMRSQFGFGQYYDKTTSTWKYTPRYVRKGSSEELSFVSGKYYDQVGQEVAGSQVKTLTGDSFNDLMAPGTTDSSGAFSSWMSDAQYQQILGTETMPTNTWRSDIAPWQFNQSTPALKKAAVIAELEAAGLPANGNAQTSDLADRILNYRTEDKAKNITANDTSGKVAYSGNDKNGNAVSGTVYFDGGSIRVAVIQARTYKAESTAVDAFLYANSRVGGKLSPRGGYLNGGVIAGEVGILATGKNNGADWWLDNLTTAERDSFNKCNTTTRPTDSSADAYKNGTNCDYAINYDYRLRNGGYGYNLYKGKTGTTSDWNLDQNGTYKVAP